MVEVLQSQAGEPVSSKQEQDERNILSEFKCARPRREDSILGEVNFKTGRHEVLDVVSARMSLPQLCV